MKNINEKNNENNSLNNNFNLIDLLYSSPAKIYSWFIANSVDVDYHDCEKLFLTF